MDQATAVKQEQQVVPQQITIPVLAEGEHYAGIVIVDGNISHHLVLLPGDTRATWKKAIDWAKKQGGDLPTRSEQALLYANLKTQFQSDWYWSGEQHASYSNYAWIQSFTNGFQLYNLTDSTYRARAVRRLPI